MNYYVFDAGTLLDILTLDLEEKKLFETNNPTFRLEECLDNPILFEDDEDYFD